MSRVLPILFNTDMVRAILDGRKTVTRRVIKNIDIEENNGMITIYEKNEEDAFCIAPIKHAKKEMALYCQYQPGDILYVRETWQHLYELDGNEQIIEGSGRYYYAASDTLPFDTYVDARGISHENIPWRPSIHMPKETARIWLKVLSVRVERLQDITEKEAEKEGAKAYGLPNCSGTSARIAFAEIWDGTVKQKEYEWPSNPWVWVIEFERCEKPEGV